MNMHLNWYDLRLDNGIPSVIATTLPNQTLLRVSLPKASERKYSMHLDGYSEYLGICSDWEDAKAKAVTAAIAMLKRKRAALDRVIDHLENDEKKAT